MKIRIDPEFAQLIPAVSPEHDGELESEVLADGRFVAPFVVWKHQGILLDGHRRWKIHLRHPELKVPQPVVLDIESRQEAHDWIIRHQLSKRNVSEAQRKYLIGKLYLEQRRPHGGDRKSDQVANLATCPKTAEKVASEHNVSPRTVRNAGGFAEAVDAVPAVKDKVLSGEVKASTKDLESLAELPTKQQAKATTAIISGKTKSVGAAVKEAKPKRGQPTIDVRKFRDLENQIGKCVRANTACKESCGGARHHEQIRKHLNECLKVLSDWRKDTA